MIHGMCKVAAVFTLLTALACVIPSQVSLQAASEVDLSDRFGAGCQGTLTDLTVCQTPPKPCTVAGAASVLISGTNVSKAWCGSPVAPPDKMVCDCNQTGIAQSNCRMQKSCADTKCTKNCGNATPASTVQTFTNNNGAICTKDKDCE